MVAAESQRLINETYSASSCRVHADPGPARGRSASTLTTAIIVDQERLGSNPRLTVGDGHGRQRDAANPAPVASAIRTSAHRTYSFNAPSVSASGAITSGRWQTKAEKATFNRLGGMCPRCEGMSVSD